MNDLLDKLMMVGGRLNENTSARDYSCILVVLPSEQADKIIQFGKQIPENEIYTDPDDPSFGRETEPHITVRYGCTTNDPDDIKPALKWVESIELTIGETSFFEPSDEYDVLKVDIQSKDLHDLNEKLGRILEFPGETYSDYKPHATIAYLKKGFVKKYLNNYSMASEEPVILSSVVLSAKDGKKHNIPFKNEKVDD